MIKKSIAANSLTLHLRLRIGGGQTIALGPGKVELLGLLEKAGSIREAARQMKMSYMKAWSLIQTMKPLVESTRGGQTGGGAKLTSTGVQAVALYKRMEHDSLRACQGSWEELQLLFPS